MQNVAILEKPSLDKGDEYHEYLQNLRKRFWSSLPSNNNQYGVIDSIFLMAQLRDLRDLKGGLEGLRVLDLGCGTGFQLAAFSNEGCLTYGIDKDPRVLDEARKNFAELKLEPNPILVHGNYLEKSFLSMTFDDGAGISDMDAVFCYYYNTPHFLDVLTQVLTDSRIKVGACISQCNDGPLLSLDYTSIFKKSGYFDAPRLIGTHVKTRHSTLTSEEKEEFLERLWEGHQKDRERLCSTANL